MDKMITQRVHEVRKGQNQTVGVFVGMVDRGVLRAGWSRVAFHLGDKFSMSSGIAFALQNMIMDKPIPRMANKYRQENFANEFDMFKDRCRRYFKGYSFAGDNVDHPCREPNVDSVEASQAKAMADIFKGIGLTGIPQETIDQFTKNAMPLVEQLTKQGVGAVGIPFGLGFGNVSDMARMMKILNTKGEEIK